MAMLVSSQLVQVFGADAEGGEQHVQDWATEPFTCSTRDLSPKDTHPEYGHPALRRAQWGGKLHFGGSETASYGGGYLEGALEAAARIQRALGDSAASAVSRDLVTSPAANDACLESFRAWVDAERSVAFERYQRQLNRQLASQLKEQLTQRAALAAMEQVYSAALTVIEALDFDLAVVANDAGRASLTPKLLAPFLGFNKALLDQVLLFNRGSCALSNFPEEHVVSPEYLETIARDLAAAWREFAVSVDNQLMSRARPFGPVATAA
jgi:monoamine oxidase